MNAIGKTIQDVNVEFCSIKKSGLIAVGFSDEKSKDLAANKIKANADIASAFSTRAPRKMLPKVTVRGISEVLFDGCNEDKEQMRTVLRNDILRRNSALKNILDADKNESLEVVMVQKVMPSPNYVNYIAALKMTPRLRKSIADADDKLYISLKRCRVADRYHVMQCYNCQDPGHSADDCPDRNTEGALIPTCGFCAKDHKSQDCPDKENVEKHSCANCLRSNNPEILKGARTHNATSRKCPILENHIKVIKNKTENWRGKNCY